MKLGSGGRHFKVFVFAVGMVNGTDLFSSVVILMNIDGCECHMSFLVPFSSSLPGMDDAELLSHYWQVALGYWHFVPTSHLLSLFYPGSLLINLLLSIILCATMHDALVVAD